MYLIGLSTFRSVEVLVCPGFGVSTFGYVDILVYRRFGLHVDVSVCRSFGLSMFRFVNVLVVDISVCRHVDQLPTKGPL